MSSKCKNMRKRHTQKVQVVSSKLADASADVPDLRFPQPEGNEVVPNRPGLP